MENASFSENSTPNSQFNCYYPDAFYVNERFYLVVIFGTTVAVVSLLENLLLLWTLALRPKHWTSHFLYLIFLAFFDVFISLSYIMLMSVNVLADYCNSVRILRIWFSYVIPMLTVSHCAMTVSSFLILAATFERYLSVTKAGYMKKFVHNHRSLVVCFVLFIGLLLKGGLFAEYAIDHKPHCKLQMAQQAIRLSALANNMLYNRIWRFWLRNILTVYLPFILLAYFNICIVIRLRQQRSSLTTLRGGIKASLRSATRMLVLVVLTYLASNLLNVVITCWETFDRGGLYDNHLAFYMFSVDVVSLLTVVASALRLPIYCSCNEHMRAQIWASLCGGGGGGGHTVSSLAGAGLLPRLSTKKRRRQAASYSEMTSSRDEQPKQNGAVDEYWNDKYPPLYRTNTSFSHQRMMEDYRFDATVDTQL